MLRKITEEFRQGKALLTFGFLKAVGMGMGMVAPLVIAKLLSPDLFGSYSLAKMVLVFFVLLVIGSSQTPFVVFGNQERAKTGRVNKTFSVLCVCVACCTCVMLGGALLFRRAIMAFADISGTELLCVSLGFVGMTGKMFLCALFMALGQRLKNSLVEMVFGAAMLASVLVLHLAGAMSVKAIFLTYLASALLVFVVFCWSIDFSVLRPFCIDRDHLRHIINFAKWTALGALALYFINWGHNLVLRVFVPMGDIGVYNLGHQVFKGMVALGYITNAYFLPFVSEHIRDRERMRDYLYRKRPRILLVALLGVVLLFVTIPSILRLLFGGTYEQAIPVVRTLLVAVAMILYTTFYIPIVNALKDYRFSTSVNIVNAAVGIGASVVLIPLMGVLGAAVAAVIAHGLATIAYEARYRLSMKGKLGL